MKSIIKSTLVTYVILCHSIFADFGVSLIYQTDIGVNMDNEILRMDMDSIIFKSDNSIKKVDLNKNIISYTINFENLNHYSYLFDNSSLIISDYLSPSYVIKRYNLFSGSLTGILHITNPVELSDNYKNGNVLTKFHSSYDSYIKISSININGVTNFVSDLNLSDINNMSFSKNGLYEFVYVYNMETSSYNLFILDSVGNKILDLNTYSFYSSFLESTDNIYILNSSHKNNNDTISSYNIATGVKNWDILAPNNESFRHFLLIDSNLTIATISSNDDSYTLNIINAQLGVQNCSLNLNNMDFDYPLNFKNSKDIGKLIISNSGYIKSHYSATYLIINSSNCQIEGSLTNIGYSEDSFIVDFNENVDLSASALDYLPMVLSNNGNATFNKVSSKGAILSSVNLGTTNSCGVKSYRTENNNFFFISDNNLTAFDSNLNPLMNITLTDTTNCYDSIVAYGDKVAIKRQSGLLSVYKIDSDSNTTTSIFEYQTFISKVNRGWNLLGNSFDNYSINANSIVTYGETIWLYENNQWVTTLMYEQLYIKSKEGFWLYTQNDRNISLKPTTNLSTMTYPAVGWSLRAETSVTQLKNLYSGVEEIYVFDNSNNNWITKTSNPNYYLDRFQGYWAKMK